MELHKWHGLRQDLYHHRGGRGWGRSRVRGWPGVWSVIITDVIITSVRRDGSGRVTRVGWTVPWTRSTSWGPESRTRPRSSHPGSLWNEGSTTGGLPPSPQQTSVRVTSFGPPPQDPWDSTRRGGSHGDWQGTRDEGRVRESTVGLLTGDHTRRVLGTGGPPCRICDTPTLGPGQTSKQTGLRDRNPKTSGKDFYQHRGGRQRGRSFVRNEVRAPTTKTCWGSRDNKIT